MRTVPEPWPGALIVAEIERLDRAPDAEARRFAWTGGGDAIPHT